MNLALLFCVVTNYANYIYHLGLNVICNGPLWVVYVTGELLVLDLLFFRSDS